LSVNTPPKFFPIKNYSYRYLFEDINKLKTSSNLKMFLKKEFLRTTQRVVHESKNIVLWNKETSISSMNKKNVLTKLDRNLINITNYNKSIIIGLILSDGWIQKRKGWNPRIGFKQSIKNFEYLWYVFNKLSVFCSNYPYLCKNIKRGKLFNSLQFQTRQLKCFNEIYFLFYKNNCKYINPELFNYIDYIALAHWIMGDGSKKNKGITLCTDSLTFKEVIILMNILKIKFNIDSTIHLEKYKPRIYINKLELNKILPYIKPYFTNLFLYKLSL